MGGRAGVFFGRISDFVCDSIGLGVCGGKHP